MKHDSERSLVGRFFVHLLVLAGVCCALGVPLDARADDLSAEELETIDRTIAAGSAAACAEPRDHLRALREAYGRHETSVVRSAIAARVPMVLDTLRFCIETTGATTTTDTIEAARRALETARRRAECSVPASGMEQLITAWDAETSRVVRGAIETRLEALTQTVRFCLETLGPEPVPVVVETPAVEAPSEPVIEPIAPLPATPPTGGRALGSPFLPAP